MSDEVILESGQEVIPEAQETPTPEVPSVPSGVERPSATSLDEDAIAVKVAAIVREGLQQDIERGIQSTKDVRFRDMERVMKYVKDADGDETLALRNMKIDELLEQQGVSRSEVPGRTEDETEAAFTAISESILSGAGIAFDDPGYLEFVAKYDKKLTTPETWRSPLQAWADNIVKQEQRQETVTEHAIVGAKSEGASTEETDDDLLENIEKLMEHPLQNVEERKELIAEAKKRGLMK